MVPLPLSAPIWDAFFTVAPLVLVGTREDDGSHDLAPKHMAMPLGWQNHFGFVCHPSHATQRNAERTGAFTVSFPRPASVVQVALAARVGRPGKSLAWTQSRSRQRPWSTASWSTTPTSGSSASSTA